MRCRAGLTLAIVLALSAARAGTAHARTIHPAWVDRQPLAGGSVVYRTTKIWVHRDRFSVDVTIANRTTHEVRFFRATGPDDPVYIPLPGFGIAWREGSSPGIHPRYLHSVLSRSFSHPLPLRLAAGESTHLTFGGRSPVLRTHRSWWLTFGRAIPWRGKVALPTAVRGGGGGYWISDKTFRS